jgi:hypothetical protein
MLQATSDSDFKDMINKGFLKDRINSTKAIMLESALDMFEGTMASSAKFTGLSKPVYNVNRLLSDSKVKSAIENAYGARNFDYVKKWTRDSVGMKRGQKEFGDIFSVLKSARVAAAFAFNPWVALKQPMSLFPIIGKVGYKNLAKGILKTNTGKQIEAMSPEMKERFLGGFMMETGQFTDQNYMSSKYFGEYSSGIINKAQKLSQAPIGLMDKYTISMLYNAVDSYVRENNSDLKGDELKQEIAKQAELLVDLTQPTYHNVLRTENARSDNQVTKMMSMFTTAPIKSLNYVTDVAVNYRNGKASKTELTNAVTGYIMSAVGVSLINYLRNLTKGDDDDDANKKLVSDVVTSMFGAPVGIGELVKGGVALATGGRYFEPEMMGLGILKDTKKLAESIINADAEKFVESMINVGMYNSKTAPVSGIIKQINTFLKGQGTSVEELATDWLKESDVKIDNRRNGSNRKIKPRTGSNREIKLRTGSNR